MGHWRLRTHEGIVVFEVDAGTEAFPILTAKLNRYSSWFDSGVIARSYRD